MEYNSYFSHSTDDGRITSVSVNFRRAVQVNEQVAKGAPGQGAPVSDHADAIDFTIVVSFS